MKECCKIGDQPSKKTSTVYLKIGIYTVIAGIVLFAIIQQL
jgi:hypothetical protein